MSAGYGYADYICEAFAIDTTRPPKRLLSQCEWAREFDAMLGYTINTLEGKWEMDQASLRATVIHSRWGVACDLEQLLEHAVVHVLRHRRQIEKFVNSASFNEQP